jgi:hypothetical protein
MADGIPKAAADAGQALVVGCRRRIAMAGPGLGRERDCLGRGIKIVPGGLERRAKAGDGVGVGAAGAEARALGIELCQHEIWSIVPPASRQMTDADYARDMARDWQARPLSDPIVVA